MHQSATTTKILIGGLRSVYISKSDANPFAFERVNEVQNRIGEYELKSVSNKSTSIGAWFESYLTDLMIMRRRYQVIERAAESKKEIDKAPGKRLLPTIPLSSLRGVPASLC